MAKSDPPIDRVRKLALKLPDVEEGTTFGYLAFKVNDRAFAWFPKKKEVEDGSLGVGRCACPGFSHDPKEAMDVGVTDVRIPRLRLAD